MFVSGTALGRLPRDGGGARTGLSERCYAILCGNWKVVGRETHFASEGVVLFFAVYTIKTAREINELVFSSSCLVIRGVLAGNTSSLVAL